MYACLFIQTRPRRKQFCSYFSRSLWPNWFVWNAVSTEQKNRFGLCGIIGSDVVCWSIAEGAVYSSLCHLKSPLHESITSFVQLKEKKQNWLHNISLVLLYSILPTTFPAARITWLHSSLGFRCDPLSNEDHQSCFPEGRGDLCPHLCFFWKL